MTYMPVLDKNSGMQNILSAKGTKSVSSSENGNFDAVLKQTNVPAGTAVSGKKAETVKSPEPSDETKGNAIRDKLNGKDKTEDGTKTEDSAKAEDSTKTEEGTKTEEAKDTKDAEAAETPADAEELTDDAETLEKAGGEMAAALAMQLDIPLDTVQEAMDELQMTEVSLLQPENVKELMIQLTDGADSMSMLTDGDFYQSVTEALHTLDGILEETAQELGMEPEEVKAFAQDLENTLQIQTETLKMPEPVQEKAAEAAADADGKETVQQQETVKLPTEEHTLTESARMEAGSAGAASEREASGKESFGKEDSGSSLQESFQNPALQQETQTAQIAEAESAAPIADTQEIMDQILDYMKVSVKPELSDLEMQLHPETLGNLHIHISSREGVVTAQFTAQNESVRAVLESQMMELKQNLESQGVKVEAVEVTIAQYSLDRNPGGGEASSGQEQKQKKAPRNLNLSELNLEEEDLTEEEKLAAEMMQSEGSTVSYTA